jgi:hypothetical protein
VTGHSGSECIVHFPGLAIAMLFSFAESPSGRFDCCQRDKWLARYSHTLKSLDVHLYARS